MELSRTELEVLSKEHFIAREENVGEILCVGRQYSVERLRDLQNGTY